MARRRKKIRPKTLTLRMLKTLHKRETTNPPMEAPPAHWFNGWSRRMLSSMIKNGYVTNGANGVRTTAKGRALIGVTHQGADG